MKQDWKRMISIFLSLVLVIGLTSPAIYAAPAKSESGLEFIEIDPQTLNVARLGTVEETEAEQVTDPPAYGLNDRVRVSIVLDAPSTLELGYEIQGIATNERAMAYRTLLRQQQDALAQRISEEILDGEPLEVKWNITLAGNMISAWVPYGKIEAIRALDGVVDVELEQQYEPMKTESGEIARPEMVNARDMVGADGPEASKYNGAGRRIAVIDTGLDDEHQSFNADAFLHAIQEDGATDKLMTAADIPSGLNGNGTYRNAKIPYAYNYVDNNQTTNHTGDTQEEHGSHVAGIASANRYLKQGDSYVSAAETVGVVGEAPDAQVMIMKVFGSGGGAYDSDYMVAIEDAMLLGADSVNLSLGSSAPGVTYIATASYRTIFNNLVGKDIIVSISMGNNTSWDSQKQLYADDVNLHTGGSPGSYSNAFTVASIDDTGAYAPFLLFNDSLELRYLEGGGDANNSPMTTAKGTYEFVYVDDVGTPENFAAVDVNGKVAICNRGSTSFFEKANAAVAQGAVAVIIANNQAGTISMDLTGYTYTNPCVSIKQAEGLAIKAIAEQHTAGNLTYYTGTIEIGGTDNKTPMKYYEMSSFSSWGVPSSLELKPEITAPGGTVYSLNGYHRAAAGGYAGGHDQYEYMSGTSMAAPQILGLSAVMGQYYTENGLREKTGLPLRTFTQSLLMSTAVPVFEEESEYYYSLLKQGAGLANVNAAVSAKSYVLMDENATTSYADGKVKAELGDDPARGGDYTYSFTLHNFGETANIYTLRTDLFTQALESNNTLMSHLTTPLDGSVTYTWELLTEPEVHDVDLNGVTNLADGQAILDKLTGIRAEDAPFDAAAADLDGNGEVTTYDAYLLFGFAQAVEGAGDEGNLLPAGGTARVTVHMVLSDAQKEELDALRVGGAYVEGFTYVESETDETHSIPVLGFYGSWTDASMFNASTYAESYYGAPETSYFTANNANGWYVRYNGSTNNSWFLGNPYVKEDTWPEGKLALNNDTVLYQATYTLIRNTNYTGFAVIKEGEEPSVIFTSNTSAASVGGAYYNTQATTPAWAQTSVRNVSPNKSVASLGLEEGDKFTFGFFALPEYYAKKENGTATLSGGEFNRLLTSGELGKGACLGYTVVLDNTKPVIDTENTKKNEDGSLTVVVSDNQHIANLRIMDVSGKATYASVVPDQTEPGQSFSQTFTFEGVELGNAITIFVGDYAGNETAMMVRIAEGDILIERDIYVPAATMENGKEYLIVNSNAVGTTNALGRNNTSVARVQLTVNEANAQVETPFIKAEDVSNTALWTATADGTGFKLDNGGYYMRQNRGSLQIRTTNSNNVWTWDGENNYLTVPYNNNPYYLRYYNNTFSINTAVNSVYLFTKSSYTEVFDENKVESVTVTPASAELFTGNQVQLQVELAPVTLTNKAVTWSSSNEEVATVDENGLVTAVSAGTANIIATPVCDPTASGAAAITVVARTALNATINAQVVENGAPKFVKINLNDLSMTALGDAAAAHYGGGRSANIITGFDTSGNVITTYITDEGYESLILGSFGTTSYNSRDGAHVPPFSASNEEQTVTEEYMSLYVANNYLLMLTEAGSLTGWSGANYTAIAYVGTDETGGHYYYLLNNSGQLVSAKVAPDETEPITVDEETGELSLNLVLSTSAAVTISGLSSSAGSFGANYMSMSVVNTEELYGLLIANTNNRRIYFVDLNAETAQAVLVAGFSGLTGLTTLYDDNYDVNVIPYDTTGIGAELMAEAASAEGIPAEAFGKPEPAGTLNGTRGQSDVGIEGVSEPATVIELTADDADTTNGLFDVTYDDGLTLVKAELNEKVDFTSIVNEAGRYVLAFVDVEGAIAAGEPAVTLYFKGSGDTTIITKELNQNTEPVVDSIPIGSEAPPAPVYGAPEWNWSDDYSMANAVFTPDTGEDLILPAAVTSEATEPTCTEAGSTVYTAEVEFQDETYTDTKTVELPALGHEYGEAVWNWNEDFSTATVTFTCARCQDAQTLEAEVTVETIAAACETPGETRSTACVVFEEITYTDVHVEELAALGHDWDEGVETTVPTCLDAGVITFTCQRCGETRTEAVDALGHDPVTVEALAPTCTEPGHTAGTVCSRCDAVLEGLDQLLPTGHSVVVDEAVAPTCTETGLTAGVHCSVCNEILIPQNEIPALGHDPKAIPAVAPTCTEPGSTEGSVCARCGEILTAPEEVEALGHDYEAVVTAPTCVDAGFTTYTCSRCGDSYVADETEALGHEFSEWAVTKEPTCVEAGEESRMCARCLEVETRPVNPLGHDAELIPAVAPTCTETGLTVGVRCKVCGEILIAQEVVEATGHAYGEPAWTWNEELTEATAKFICANDPAHVEELKAVITEEVTVEPTDKAEGEKTVTATVEFNGETYTDVKTVVLEKLEHDCPCAAFTDMPELGTVEHDAIDWAFTHDPQITTGTSATTFGPEKTVTRGQAVTFLWRAAGCPEPTSTEHTFTDVKETGYYYKAMLWAVEKGITTGTSATRFSPNKTCTIEQILTFIYRYMEEPEVQNTENPWTDVNGEGFSFKAIMWAVENGIVAPKSETVFGRKDDCTRASIVTFLYRIMTGEGRIDVE